MPNRTAREQSRRARIGCAGEGGVDRQPRLDADDPALRRNAQAQDYHAEIQRLADQARRMSLHPTPSDRSNPNFYTGACAVLRTLMLNYAPPAAALCQVRQIGAVRPSGPRALNRTTQSRRVCSPTPPIRAALVREPPS